MINISKTTNKTTKLKYYTNILVYILLIPNIIYTTKNKKPFNQNEEYKMKNKTQIIGIRVNESQKDRLETQAEIQDKSLSQYVRDKLFKSNMTDRLLHNKLDRARSDLEFLKQLFAEGKVKVYGQTLSSQEQKRLEMI